MMRSAAQVPTLHIRPASFDDFDGVLKLIVQQHIADFGEPLYSAERLRERWQSLDLAEDSWLALTPAGRLLGYGELQHKACAEFYPQIYLSPHDDAQTVGANLLQRMEARAATLYSGTTGPGFISQVSDHNTTLKQLYATAGFTWDVSFLLMQMMMTFPPPLPVWPDDVTVRALRVGADEQRTYQADEEASQDKGYYQPKTFEEWADRMRLHSDEFDPTLWFLACQHGDIVGVCLNRLPEAAVGLIDHLGVRRPWRKQGIGRALLLHAFGEFYRRGIRRVTLSVDAHSTTHAHQLYERAGMQTYQQYHVYIKGDV